LRGSAGAGTILAGAEDILDFREPVAVLLVAVLHFVPIPTIRMGSSRA